MANLPDYRADFAGKVVFVSGAASGLGKAAVEIFSTYGARVVAADIGFTRDGDLQSDDGSISAMRLDVSDAEAVEHAFVRIEQVHGRVDIAFNNAGVIAGYGDYLHEASLEDWDKVVNVGFRGVMLCMRAELARMAKSGSGVIVNTSSVAGLRSGVNAAAYAASKSGVLGVTRSAALQYAARGIRINAVCPGVIATNMSQQISAARAHKEIASPAAIPMGRTGQPEEIAHAVVWLCSSAASYVTGVALPVDGGWSAS